MTARRGLIIGAAIGIVFGIALIVAVFATGSTFGQRCDRAFPSDPERSSLCVKNLAKGRAP